MVTRSGFLTKQTQQVRSVCMRVCGGGHGGLSSAWNQGAWQCYWGFIGSCVVEALMRWHGFWENPVARPRLAVRIHLLYGVSHVGEGMPHFRGTHDYAAG